MGFVGTIRIAIIAALLPVAPDARAEAPVLAIEAPAPPLRVDGTGAPFRIDEAAVAEFRVHNRGAAPLELIRLAVGAAAGLEVAPLDNDALDNDDDGETDEADEALRADTAQGWVWRLPLPTVLAPGEALTRRVRLRTTGALLPGGEGTLTVRAAARGAQSGPPLRAVETYAVPFATPETRVIDWPDGALSDGERATLRLRLKVPAGEIPGATLSLAYPPALVPDGAPEVRAGDALSCTRAFDGPWRGPDGTARMTLGDCTIRPGENGGDAPVEVDIPLRAVDAPDSVVPEDVDGWRRGAVAFALESAAEALTSASVPVRLSGPLPRIGIVEAPADAARAGERVTARVALRNAGDVPLSRPRLRLSDPARYDCDSLRVDGAPAVADGCGAGAPLGLRIGPGEVLRAQVSARLRKDAALAEGGALALVLSGVEAGEGRAEVPLALVPPLPPRLSVLDPGAWRQRRDVWRAVPGAGARLRLSADWPDGRYPRRLRLLSRFVEAETGAPTGPAVMRISDLVRLGPEDAPREGPPPEIEVRGAGVWAETVFTLPDGDADGGVEDLLFDAVLADTPGATLGRLVEITAEIEAFDGIDSPSRDWIEVVVDEPRLEARIVGLDGDRALDPGEGIHAIGLVCNHGSAAAHGAVLRMDMPPGTSALDPRTGVAAALVPLAGLDEDIAGLAGRAATGAGALLEVKRGMIRVRVGTPDDDDAASLAAGACLLVELSGLHFERPAEATARVALPLGVEPFTAGAAPRARSYPALIVPPVTYLRRALTLGPASEGALDGRGHVRHEATLTVPAGLGPFRASVQTGGGDIRWFPQVMDADGRWVRWDDGRAFPAGVTLRLAFDGVAEGPQPLGWAETTAVSATILANDGRTHTARTRFVTRQAGKATPRVSALKTLALDRNCDGALDDEDPQDAAFEAVKDAARGECVVFRIAFRNAGDTRLERMVVRETVPSGVTLLRGTPLVTLPPEGVSATRRTDAPGTDDPVVGWRFDGLFDPGAFGEVEYVVRIGTDEDARGSQ